MVAFGTSVVVQLEEELAHGSFGTAAEFTKPRLDHFDHDLRFLMSLDEVGSQRARFQVDDRLNGSNPIGRPRPAPVGRN